MSGATAGMTISEKERLDVGRAKVGVPAPSRINLEFPKRYENLVAQAKKRFPKFTVWGSHIHKGHGYGVFVSDGKRISCFQVRSLMLIDGVPHRNDILDASKEEMPVLLRQAFDSVEKGLKAQIKHAKQFEKEQRKNGG